MRLVQCSSQAGNEENGMLEYHFKTRIQLIINGKIVHLDSIKLFFVANKRYQANDGVDVLQFANGGSVRLE